MQFLEPLYNKIAIIIMSTTFLARVESFFFTIVFFLEQLLLFLANNEKVHLHVWWE